MCSVQCAEGSEQRRRKCYRGCRFLFCLCFTACCLLPAAHSELYFARPELRRLGLDGDGQRYPSLTLPARQAIVSIGLTVEYHNNPEAHVGSSGGSQRVRVLTQRRGCAEVAGSISTSIAVSEITGKPARWAVARACKTNRLGRRASTLVVIFQSAVSCLADRLSGSA